MVLRSGLCVGMAALFVLGCGGGDSGRPLPNPGGCTSANDADGDHHCGDDDCDDANPSIFRGSNAVETCMDANCDGIGGPDADGDGHEAEGCPGGDDCDDGRAGTYPGALDMVGVGGDEDCDGLDGVDADRDLHASEASGGDDCNDADASIYPGATDDIDPSGIDENCSGADGVDRDGDGHPDAEQGGDDCDDRDALTFPGAPDEFGDEDHLDTNCDGVDGVDADLDGFASDEFGGSDCDDADPDIHPFASGDWVWTTISDTVRGDPPSPALASDGTLRVAYIQENGIGTNEAWVGSNASGTWTSELVDESPHCVALALDADDGLHVIFRDDAEQPQYATRQAGAWSIEAVGGFSATGLCNIGVAADGSIGTAYSTGDNALTYNVHPAGGSWSSAAINPEEVATADVSFAFDSAAHAHVAYSDDSGVHYATDASGAWVTQDVADGTSPFLVLVADEPRMVFRGASFVQYATPGVEEWTLDPLGSDGLSPHLAFKANGDIEVVFGYDPGVVDEDPAVQNVVWAEKRGGGGWSSQDVQPVEHVELVGRVVIVDGVTPVFFVVEDGATEEDPKTLYFTERAAPNGVDDDCDGRVW